MRLLFSLTAILLAAGILPSLTRLSETYFEWLPTFSRYTGPLNPIKLGIPILALFVWTQRSKFPGWLWSGVMILLAAGTCSTLISAANCNFSPEILREWGSFGIGLLAALALHAFPDLWRTRILLTWAGLVYGSVALDLLAPIKIDWLYERIFDPATRSYDLIEVGRRVLTGVFGRQSLSKLMAWIPWLLLALVFLRRKFQIGGGWLWIMALAGGVTLALIIATSQRGPFVAFGVGCLAFVAHQLLRTGNREVLTATLVGAVVAGLAIAVLVPRDVWEPRFRSLLGMEQVERTQVALNTEANINVRINMNRLSLKVISESPLGNACIPIERFYEHSILFKAHSHNLYLEQFRSRGWIWGLLHLALWIVAWTRSWQIRSAGGSALFAGLTTIMVTGAFDHLWQVMNQSIILWVFLIAGWRRKLE